jgi:hypothetical protein
MPVWAAVLAGWLCAILLLLARAGPEVFRFPAEPSRPPGIDLHMLLDYSRAWLAGGNPYVGLNPYPPLAAVLFAPLTALPFAGAYAFLTVLTLAAFISVAVVLPLRALPGADRLAVLGIALAGLCSYGLCFELRWGQFNVLALAGTAWGIFLFHRGRSRGARLAGLGLFSLAIQLKVYPAIFVFALARDARAWRTNLARWAALGLFNLALLFALGPRVFADFLHSLKAQAEAPYVWAGNHSIQSFAEWAGRPALAPVLAGFFAMCFLGALGQAARRPGRASFAGLVLMAALGAMLLPGVSHDYKLPAFALGFAFFAAAARPLPLANFRDRAAAGLWLALAFLFAWTLFTFEAKPLALQNNAPVLLAAAGVLALGLGRADRREAAA